MTKKPPTFKSAAFLVFVREGHYCLAKHGSGSDNRLIGICDDCLEGLNDFQKEYKKPVDACHPDYIPTFI
jgi:hypothetical protein